ncbi:MAG: hypothetical protein IKA25_01420 [Alphaproteobacteria bacterium]|nr:hypothetical protein [Alphaproteobacteria bacterium]
MSDKFMADLLQNLLSDQDVRACIEKLHTNAQELGKILAKQISTRVIDEVLTQSADVASAQSQSVDAPKKAHGKRKSEWATASDASLRAAVFYRTKRNLPIEPELNNVLSARFRGWDATTHKFTRARAARKDENKTADVAPAANKNELRVCVRPVKTTLNGTYNNVLVNGRKILSNHFDTDIKILSDGEILAIHGIVTDDKTLPETMQWRVYYADLTSAIPSIKQSYSGYNAHARSVHEMPDGGIRIDMSNRSSLLPRVERIRKLANGKKFVLDEKQR